MLSMGDSFELRSNKPDNFIRQTPTMFKTTSDDTMRRESGNTEQIRLVLQYAQPSVHPPFVAAVVQPRGTDRRRTFDSPITTRTTSDEDSFVL